MGDEGIDPCIQSSVIDFYESIYSLPSLSRMAGKHGGSVDGISSRKVLSKLEKPGIARL